VTHLTKLLRYFSDLIYMKHLEQGLAHLNKWLLLLPEVSNVIRYEVESLLWGPWRQRFEKRGAHEKVYEVHQVRGGDLW
jgi:hypothetical protein